MEDQNKSPFPQANDFQKILSIININEPKSLFINQQVMELLGFSSERQVHYYISACIFLDILDHNRSFTDFGLCVRESGRQKQINNLAMTIISKPIFGDVFLQYFFYNKLLSIIEIADLIHIYYGIDNNDVCYRRASTVYSWIKWIVSLRDLQQKTD